MGFSAQISAGEEGEGEGGVVRDIYIYVCFFDFFFIKKVHIISKYT
jgi:hypothetical protein